MGNLSEFTIVMQNLPELRGICQTIIFSCEGNLPDIRKIRIVIFGPISSSNCNLLIHNYQKFYISNSEGNLLNSAEMDDGYIHRLRTPNEGINQRYLKNWADVADKIRCRHT